MAKNYQLKVDPRQWIPPELRHLTISEERNGRIVVTENVPFDPVVTQEYTPPDGGNSSTDESPQPPTGITVVSQTIHTSPDGTQTVDVVINIADVLGALGYDVRIVKG